MAAVIYFTIIFYTFRCVHVFSFGSMLYIYIYILFYITNLILQLNSHYIVFLTLNTCITLYGALLHLLTHLGNMNINYCPWNLRK